MMLRFVITVFALTFSLSAMAQTDQIRMNESLHQDMKTNQSKSMRDTTTTSTKTNDRWQDLTPEQRTALRGMNKNSRMNDQQYWESMTMQQRKEFLKTHPNAAGMKKSNMDTDRVNPDSRSQRRMDKNESDIPDNE